ncbi:MAG TPA: transposase, partial [Ktedonobacterales bacterium]|nr:transposase [Ktedonobacterales bacterium]
VKDSEWLADLLRHGLLRPSFIPPQPIRALRELTRYRKTLVRERTAQINRLQKVLEAANIKLAAVATDVLGKSPREMLEALIGGEEDVTVLAEQARGRLRAKIPELKRALKGRLQPQHGFLLRTILAHRPYRLPRRRHRAGACRDRAAPCPLPRRHATAADHPRHPRDGRVRDSG